MELRLRSNALTGTIPLSYYYMPLSVRAGPPCCCPCCCLEACIIEVTPLGRLRLPVTEPWQRLAVLEAPSVKTMSVLCAAL